MAHLQEVAGAGALTGQHGRDHMQGLCDGSAAGSLAHSLARHKTELMNNAWGHLPPLNYRSVEAQHMGTAPQVLMANSMTKYRLFTRE